MPSEQTVKKLIEKLDALHAEAKAGMKTGHDALTRIAITQFAIRTYNLCRTLGNAALAGEKLAEEIEKIKCNVVVTELGIDEPSATQILYEVGAALSTYREAVEKIKE